MSRLFKILISLIVICLSCTALFACGKDTVTSTPIINPPVESVQESDPVSNPESDPESDPESEPESNPESEPETDPESEPESDPESEPEEDNESNFEIELPEVDRM